MFGVNCDGFGFTVPLDGFCFGLFTVVWSGGLVRWFCWVVLCLGLFAMALVLRFLFWVIHGGLVRWVD